MFSLPCGIAKCYLTGGVLMTNKHLFSRLLKKAILMALWTKAITCDKAGFKSRFCREHKAGKNIISVNSVILSNFSSCLRFLLGEKIREISVNPWLIKDLRSTKDYVRKNKLFLQNEPKFQKVKLNVTKVLTRDYDPMDTWSIRKNEPKTNPKRTQF